MFRFQVLALLFCIEQTVLTTASWPPPIITNASKLFDSSTLLEFRVKGMAYYPRPNAGELAGHTGVDFAADEYEEVWTEHIKIMQDLNVNTIRLYSVDPSKSHDKFMCACAQAGIYVLVGIAAPCEGCAIADGTPPGCYPDGLLTRAMMIYNAFAPYDNLLGLSVGNENNLQPGKTTTAPCVKAFLRDVKNYAAYCSGSLRIVPIGLDVADINPRSLWIKYYDCAVDNNEFSRADYIGFNQYTECDPLTHLNYSQSTGLQNMMKEFADTGISRPIMFGEFGCNLGKNTIDGWENQRAFSDALWMNTEKQMTDVIVGGCVFEFSVELANLVIKNFSKKHDTGDFGVTYFTPPSCTNEGKDMCKTNKKPEYYNLKKAYQNTPPSTVSLNTWVPPRNNILECPAKMSIDLPKTPGEKVLACSTRQPICNGKPSNAFPKKDLKVKMGTKTKPTNKGERNFEESSSNGGMRLSASTILAALVGLLTVLMLK